MWKFIALPTWLTIQIARRFFPENHIWKRRFYTLQDWYRGRSDLTAEFDCMLWISLAAIFGLVLEIWLIHA